MNLPAIPHKTLRRNWHHKIKREENETRDKSLKMIRTRLLRELKKNLRNRRRRRLRLRRSLHKPKIHQKPKHLKPNPVDDIDEKIRIIYAMRHKNKKHSVKPTRHKANSRKDTRKNHWRSILPLRAAAKHKKSRKVMKKKMMGRRYKRENEQNLHNIKKIVVRNATDVTNGSSITSSRSSPQLNIGNEGRTSQAEKTFNDTTFYNHLMELQKELLKRSNTCKDNCTDIHPEKYEKVKNLVHAGSHYLLRRFGDCESCKCNSCSRRDHKNSSVLLQGQIKIKREDHAASEVESMAEKILNFASSIDSGHEKREKIGAASRKNELKGIVDKFGIDELGLTSEDDRKSLAALVHEIINVQKNVNETLQIIRNRLEKRKNVSSRKSKKSVKKKPEKGHEKKSKGKKKSKKKNKPKKSRNKTSKGKKKSEKVKKSLSDHESVKKKTISKSKKKLDKKSNSEKRIDELGEEIREILTEDSNTRLNLSRKIRSAVRSPRDVEDTNIVRTWKYRSVRNPSESTYDDFEKSPNFLDIVRPETKISPARVPQENDKEKQDKIPTRDSRERQTLKVKHRSRALQHLKPSTREGDGPEKDHTFKVNHSGGSNFIDEPSETRKGPTSHFSIQRKLQSSQQLKPKRKSHKKSSRKHLSTKNLKKLKKTLIRGHKRSSQTVVPIDHGRIRVKYIYREQTSTLQHPLQHSTPSSLLKVTGDSSNCRSTQKAAVSRVSNSGITNLTNRESCICDLEEAIEELKRILSFKGDALLKVIEYECTKFQEIGDDIVLVSTGIIGDVLPRSRRDLAEAKGMKYVKPGDLEDVLRFEDREERSDNDVMSFPGSDLNVPCNREGEDITWLTSISKPNYTWTREDGLPVSGLVTKSGNLELYDVDAKDTGNYICFVSYVDPDNEELVRNVYLHKIQGNSCTIKFGES